MLQRPRLTAHGDPDSIRQQLGAVGEGRLREQHADPVVHRPVSLLLKALGPG